jgi:hypothetical protein
MRPFSVCFGTLPLVSSRKTLLVLFAVLSLFLCPHPAFPQSHALTLPRNLVQLVDESELVVQGRITSVMLEPHAQLNNLLTVVVTLQVEETLKGTIVGTYTFRQAAIDRRDQQQKMGYRVGQRLLLTLIRPSVYGLTSPAGMQQGRFSIIAGADGKLQATNGFGNAGLFRGLDTELPTYGTHISPEVRAMVAQANPGPIPLDDLKRLIRSLATRNSPQ